MKIYADGACIGNEQKDKENRFGAWAITNEEGQLILRGVEYAVTNNEMEYMALKRAMEYYYQVNAGKKLQDKHLIVCVDSQLIVGQLTKNWRIKDSELKKLNANVKWLEAEIKKKKCTFTLVKVPRKENKAGEFATALAHRFKEADPGIEEAYEEYAAMHWIAREDLMERSNDRLRLPGILKYHVFATSIVGELI